jgi:serine/threonine-protein kinase
MPTPEEHAPASSDVGDAPPSPPPASPQRATPPLAVSALGSGLLAKQPTPGPEEMASVARVCPQCGGEYDTTDRFCPKDGTPLRPKGGNDPLIGRVIADRYLILALLGEGGMGRVYLAEHVKMNRQCAVKVMNPSLIHDDDSHQRFAREASSAASILHPNVAAVFDYGEADKIVYLVMEYVDGESISAIVAREGALDPRRAIDIARQVADGLHAAHELGIVHRDLKPDNIIVTRNKSGKEIPKVVDFGIAKAVTDSREDGLTQSGLVIGTPEYMSPEQLLGDPVDARADIYSLGCILYQMLTGRPAFAAESREQLIRRRLHESPPHVRDALPDLPRRLDTTIVHMLARSPKDRMPTAAEARDALDPALVLGGWDPGNITVPSPLATMGPYRNDPSLQPTVPMPKAQARPRRVAFATGIGAVLLIGAVSLIRLMTLDGAPASAAPTPSQSVAATPVSDSLLDTLPITIANTARADSLAKLASAAAKDSAKKAVRPASKAPASKAKTSPTPPVVAATMPANNAVAEKTDEFAPSLNQLVEAIQSKKLDAVEEAFPNISANQHRAFEQLFDRAKTSALKIKVEKTTPQVVDGRATAKVTLTVTYNDPNSLAPTGAPYAYDAAWEARGGSWKLTELKSILPESR